MTMCAIPPCIGHERCRLERRHVRRAKWTTYRYFFECGGWQAYSVAVGVDVWSVIHTASGETTSELVIRYVERAPPTSKITTSPGRNLSMSRKGWSWVTRWPATTALPGWPGVAVPGQRLGPR